MGRLVYQCWEKTAAMDPSAAALVETVSASQISFGQLHDGINLRMEQLHSLGPMHNRIVACQYPNCSEWIEIFLACQALNVIAMPVDWDVPPEALKRILETVKASALWTRSGLIPLENGARYRNACLIKLTSGSTGNSRPIFFSDAQMLSDCRNIMETMLITGSDSNLATIPFGHSYGLGNLIMPLIMKGCSIHLCRDPFPHALSSVVKTGRPTVYPTVPAILKALVRSDVNPADLGSIRLWISAGSILDPQVAVEFRKKYRRTVHNFYGSTETGGIAYDHKGEDTGTGRSVGKPLSGVKVSLSSTGRLIVASNSVFTRHNRRCENHLGKFLMPDRASILADGSIHLLGRTTRLAKLGGKRISLSEVENALTESNAVDACHVGVYEDTHGHNRIAAVFVSKLPVGEIQSKLKTRIAAWKVPSRWVRVDALPTNARGKLNRQALQRLTGQDSAEQEKR